MGVNGIYGLSGSGVDVESMVKVGMMSKQNEYDKMAQKYTKNEWIKADYLELSNKITTFNSSTLSQYKMSTTMNARSAESSNSAVKVSANSTAGLMNHRVDVKELSSNAYLISQKDSIKRINTSSDTYSSDSIYLKDILFKNLNVSSDNKTVTSMSTLDHGITSSQPPYTYYTAGNIKTSEKAFSFYIGDGATKEKDANGIETDNFKKAEISFTYEEIINGATLNDLASKINAAGLNIRASYDSVQDQFSIYNKLGGADNKIELTSYENNNAEQGSGGAPYTSAIAFAFMSDLKLTQSQDGQLTDHVINIRGRGNTDSISGKSGIINVDGFDYETKDNRITVGGVTYTALNTTGTMEEVTDPDTGTTSKVFKSNNAATVSVTQDTDSIIDKVKSFVTEYNTLLASLYEKYDEKPNSDYKPLTQSQRDQMKDDQIEKWEKKAKAGMLYHDQTLGKVIQNMRTSVSEAVDGIDSKYNSIYSLGISTTGIKGQLVLDEDKLKTALANDPDAVYNVFAKLDSKDINDSAKSGVAQRLGDIFVEATSKIKDRAGSSADITEDSDLNNLLRNLQTKMSNFKRMMNSFEDALYKKYDAMESTLAKLGTQLNYIMGSTGS